MSTFVLPHIDELGSFFDGEERRIHHGVGLADHGDYRPVRSLPRVDIYELDALRAVELGRNGIDDTSVFSFTEIRDTLD
jgi:hypothetical protein